MADEIFLDNLNSTPVSEIKFLNEEWAYITDVNNNNYTTNPLNFQTKNLSSNDAYFLWSEAVLVLPTVTQVKAYCLNTVGGGGGTPLDSTFTQVDCAIVPKSGSHNWVSKMQITADGKEITCVVDGINEIANAKLLMETSSSGLNKNGAFRNFYPDTSNSWKYSTAVAGQVVQGYSNNRLRNDNVITAYDTVFNNAAINYGLQKRAIQACEAVANPNLTAITGVAVNAASVCKNVSVFDTVNHTALYSVNTVCIPLKDISEFHKNLNFPIKNLSQELKFTLNTGTFTSTVYQSAANQTGFTYIKPTSQIAGGTTCPVMLTDAFLTMLNAQFNVGGTNPAIAAPSIAGSVTLTCAVGTTLTSPTGGFSVAPHLTQARIYVPYVKFAPTYVPADKQKRVKFLEYNIASPILNAGGVGVTLNYSLGNTYKNVKRVFMLCYVSSANASQGVSTLLSPYADANPQAAWFTAEQLSLNNVPFSRCATNYLFETFMKELKRASLNGGSDDSLCSGLLDSLDHSSLYSGLKVWDVSRNNLLAPDATVQISYQGTMQTLLPIDIHFYIEFEKEVVVDLQTGSIIQ